MGSCCAKKNNDERLLPKGSLDYSAVSTNINWEVIDDNEDKRRKSKTNHADVYVAIDDDEMFQKRLSQIGKPPKTRLRQPSHQQSNPNSLNSNISITIEESEHLRNWKPQIIQTYNAQLKAIKDFDNRSLLALLKLFYEYFEQNMTKEQKLSISSTKETTTKGTTPNGEEEGMHNIQDEDSLNPNAYKSFLSLYNWFEKEGKKGGQSVKSERIFQFCQNMNLWFLPIELSNYLSEYYTKTNGMNKASLTEKDQFYLDTMRKIMSINQSLLKNVNFAQINGIRLYYKVHYSTNYTLYCNRTPLLLISEHGQTKEDWLRLPKLLAMNRMIIIPDLRGIGQTGISNSASLQNNYSIDLLSSDIAGLCEKICPKKPLFVLGNGALGGIIAQTLCIRFEHLVNGLILCNALIPSNNGPKNRFIAKYTNSFMNNATFKNQIKQKKKSKNEFINIGCVESVPFVLSKQEQKNKKLDDEKEGMKANECVFDDALFYFNYDAKKDQNAYSFVMETSLNDKVSPFKLQCVNGFVPASLLNRPMNGLLAQSNGLNKKNNVNSSRVHEIKSSTLILHGSNDCVVPCEWAEFVSSKLIDVEVKEVKILNDCGHLWWLTHCEESAQIINDFLFRIERNSLTRYDVIIEDVMNKNCNLNEDYVAIISSKSFVSDENDEFAQKYELSSNEMASVSRVNPFYCRFLCVLKDLGSRPLEIEVRSIVKKKLIGMGQCMLTEAVNASLIFDIHSTENNEVMMQFNVRHGWNKEEFQKRLNEEEDDGLVTPDGYNQQRLDSADFDGLDL